MKLLLRGLVPALLVVCAGLPVQAHIVLDQPKAEAGASYKAAFRVGHGCDGSATTAITVRLPAGFLGAKPVPKAGWTIAIRKDQLAVPYQSHGRTVSEDVVEVSWRADSPQFWLADAWYDEFTLRGQLPDKPGAMWFKVLQVCEKGQTDWAEIPASGQSTKGLKSPAALLEIVPAPAAAHHHH